MRATRVVGVILAIAILGAACGDDNGAPATDVTPGVSTSVAPSTTVAETPVAGGALTMNTFSQATGLDPIVVSGSGVLGGAEMVAIYDTVMRYNPETRQIRASHRGITHSQRRLHRMDAEGPRGHQVLRRHRLRRGSGSLLDRAPQVPGQPDAIIGRDTKHQRRNGRRQADAEDHPHRAVAGIPGRTRRVDRHGAVAHRGQDLRHDRTA